MKLLSLALLVILCGCRQAKDVSDAWIRKDVNEWDYSIAGHPACTKILRIAQDRYKDFDLETYLLLDRDNVVIDTVDMGRGYAEEWAELESRQCRKDRRVLQ